MRVAFPNGCSHHAPTSGVHGHPSADDVSRAGAGRYRRVVLELWDGEGARAVRAACWSGDGPGLVALLEAPWGTSVLQTAGEGVVRAVAEGVSGVAGLAVRGAAALRERAWAGDEELAEVLEAAVGMGPWPPLAPLAVDLEELADLLEGDPSYGVGRVDLTTGDCLPGDVDAYGDAPDNDDPERWLVVCCAGSRDGYRDMRDFAVGLRDERLAEPLARALSGRGAFRRFKDTLADAGDDLLARFHVFSEERRRGRARAWLAEHGYRPVARIS